MSSLPITERAGRGNLGDGEGKAVPEFSSFAARPTAGTFRLPSKRCGMLSS